MDMELLKYGTSGAKSAITEAPRKMNFKNIMNRPPQQHSHDKNDEENENIENAIKNGLNSIFGK